MDLTIVNFREKLVQDINEAQLPLEVKRMVLSELLYEVTKATEEVIQKQKEETKQQEE